MTDSGFVLSQVGPADVVKRMCLLAWGAADNHFCRIVITAKAIDRSLLNIQRVVCQQRILFAIDDCFGFASPAEQKGFLVGVAERGGGRRRGKLVYVAS